MKTGQMNIPEDEKTVCCRIAENINRKVIKSCCHFILVVSKFAESEFSVQTLSAMLREWERHFTEGETEKESGKVSDGEYAVFAQVDVALASIDGFDAKRFLFFTFGPPPHSRVLRRGGFKLHHLQLLRNTRMSVGLILCLSSSVFE
ncbi:hypothetical protein K7X08_017268 [Anisodus acutangulus]|uniref:Uncharacterized protein n=1 Tax=Anisodus acutangulus TaxID=402998 RepID=A0A9Q1LW34_9SOLA|nr:hypothetical protein K7X08_017268 [Anisodus acutangulus]